MKTKKADMHIHSHFSDGDCSPQELVKRIKVAGLEAAVLTDHDDISGQKEFMDLCVKNGIHTMTGVEISTTYSIPEYNFLDDIRILGYGFVSDCLREYDEFLKHNIQVKISQVMKIVDNYKKSGRFETSFDEMKKQLMVPNPFVSKYWLAKIRAVDFINRSCDSLSSGDLEKRETNFQDALKKAFKEINEGGQFFNPHENFISLENAIGIINCSRGVSVWAHPIKNFRKLEKIFGGDTGEIFEHMVSFAIDNGLYGLEVYTPESNEEDIDFLLEICKAYGLNPNFGGSNYHGDRQNEHFPDRHLGQGGINHRQFNGIVDSINSSLVN